MEINGYTPYIPTQDNSLSASSRLTHAYDEKDAEELKAACKDCEAIFVNMLLKEMRKSVPTSDTSFAESTYTELLDEEIANNLSKGKGIGIADMMYKQLSTKLNNTYKVTKDE